MRKLRRGDLLDLLLEQSWENQRLREQLQAAQDALEDKTLCIDRAGSIAEASLQLSGVFQAAEQACQLYTQNIMQLNQRQDAICAQREKESQQKAAQIVRDAQKAEAGRGDHSRCAETVRGNAGKGTNRISEMLGCGIREACFRCRRTRRTAPAAFSAAHTRRG